jgi:hypothetical protein
MQGQAVGKSEEGFKGEFEGERRLVDAARLALVEEKARIAKLLEQQGEILQQEVDARLQLCLSSLGLEPRGSVGDIRLDLSGGGCS